MLDRPWRTGSAATLPGVLDSVIAAAISSSVSGRRLLDHPYYRAWQEGELTLEDLQTYAEQYRHFERSLPEVLADAAARMAAGEARSLVEANLDDELTNPRPHLELFEDFGRAVGAAAEVEPSSAMAGIVDLYRGAVTEGPVALLAVVGAYEAQAAEIAATKASALESRYGIDRTGTSFWSVHSVIEEQHSAWTVEALDDLDAAGSEVGDWSRRSAEAWWRFLDERQAARGVGAFSS